MHPLIHIGAITIPAYGLCMAAGILVACLVAYYRFRSRGGNLDALLLITAVSLAIGLCCAKLSYYLFSYGIGRFISEVLAGNYSAFSDAGLVYYGGLIGGIIGALIAIQACKYDFNTYANAVIPCVPLGHAFGRIGCLLAGCCYGLHYEGPLAVHSVYVNSLETLFPIQAVESIVNIILFLLLRLYTRKARHGFATLAIYTVLYAIARFVLEFFRGDQIRGIYMGLSTSQWISAILFVSGMVFLILRRKRTKTSSNGVQVCLKEGH